MTPVMLYLLKVVVCSGVLTGYYFLALRNKVFHQWNRFYLLLTVLFSLSLPLFEFTVFHTPEESREGAIRMLAAVQSGREELIVLSGGEGFSFEALAPYFYGLPSLILACGLVVALFRISALVRSHAVQDVQNIKFIPTEVKGTPFSFFRYIFWNKAIDMSSSSGTQIFQHELVHVRQWHTIDKLLLQIVLIFFWCNPFFWIIRFELRIIHEFIADKKSVEQQDASGLAALILQTAYPRQYAQIINPFFHHSIKRRLHMLTKIQNPHLNYFSRLAILPLLVLLGTAFAVKTSTIEPQAAALAGDKTYTVVIDAGHGGSDAGAGSAGLLEKDLTLALAQQVKGLNKNGNINIVLTRSSDAAVPLEERVQRAAGGKADLFLSLHINADEPWRQKGRSGFEVRVQHDTSAYAKQSRMLGSALMQSLSALYKTASTLEKPAGSVYVLKAAECPAILLECGYLTHAADRAFIQQAANQKAVARRILEGIEQYFAAGKPGEVRDTIPAGLSPKDIQEINVLADKSIEVKLKNGTTKSYTQKELRDAGLVHDAYGIKVRPRKEEENGGQMSGSVHLSGTFNIDDKDTSQRPLLVLNGEVYPYEALNAVNPTDITEVKVLKDKTAMETWGGRGKNGVIEVVLRKGASTPSKTGPFTPITRKTVSFSSDSVRISAEGEMNIYAPAISIEQEPTFTKVETAPQFPNGQGGWSKFLQHNLNRDVIARSGLTPGNYTVTLEFIVEKDGSISNVKALSKVGKGLEGEAIRIIGNSPRWVPAMQNGQKVRAFWKQDFPFTVQPTYGFALPWLRKPGC